MFRGERFPDPLSEGALPTATPDQLANWQGNVSEHRIKLLDRFWHIMSQNSFGMMKGLDLVAFGYKISQKLISITFHVLPNRQSKTS